MKKTFSGLSKTVGLLLLVVGCSSPKQQEASDTAEEKSKPVFYTVNYPLQYFAQQMSDGWADVKLAAPPHVDPAFWMPNQRQVLAIQQSDLLFTNGADYAKWLDKVSIPYAKMVNTSSAFQDRYLKVEHTITHSHGPEGEHSHEGIDFNTWLDPKQAILQAKAIEAQLVKKFPHKEESIRQAANELYSTLAKLDNELTETFALLGASTLLASHPVYGYLARRYSFEVNNLYAAPNKPFTQKQLEKIRTWLTKEPTAIMLWEAQPLHELKEQLAGMSIQTVIFHPCANEPATGNYLSVMKENIENLKAVRKPEK